jgi:hypothetical protein
MIGLVAPAGLAVLLALVLGGSFTGWARVRVRWWPIAIGSLAVQLVLHNPPLDQQPWAITWGPWIWVIAMLSMLAVLGRNAVEAGTNHSPWRVAALGAALNVVVVVANGGYMPQSAEARDIARDVGLPPQQEMSVRLHNVTSIGPESRLAWLADVIPQPAWLPRANVVSLGDLLLSVGLGWWAFQSTALVPRHHVRRAQLVEAQ